MHLDAVTSSRKPTKKQAHSTPLANTSPPTQPSTSEVTRATSSTGKKSVSPPEKPPADEVELTPFNSKASDDTFHGKKPIETPIPFSFQPGSDDDAEDALPAPDAPRKTASARSRFAMALQQVQEGDAAAPVVPAASGVHVTEETLVPPLPDGGPAADVTRSSQLRFSPVAGGEGLVQVASALSAEGAILGELRVPAHGSTGARRAADGDEMYFLQRGLLECDVGWLRVTLREGDWLRVPHMASYEFRNKFNHACQLVFFSITRTQT